MNVKQIVGRFGGNRPMARTLGIPESTVRGWVQAGVISTKHLPGVLAAGRDLDPPITPDDFFDTDGDEDAAPQKAGSRPAAAD